jgi:secreted trypsin-like serine protease
MITLVGCEMSLSETPCYKPKPTNHRSALRIVGGSDASRGDTPYMVGLMKHGGVVCGASIISENFLILAAHCVCNNLNKVIKPTQVKAFVGMYKISEVKKMNENEIDDDDEGIRRVFVEKIIVHPGYVCGKKAENDIGEVLKTWRDFRFDAFLFPAALLELSTPIKFNDNVQPLCLPSDESEAETLGVVVGWGWTNEDFSLGEKPDTLQKAEVPLWENEECQISYRNMMKANKISETLLCAGAKHGGVDSCWADSGDVCELRQSF